MKPADFSVHVTTFLTHYLAAQRNMSPNTIKAYRDVFTLLLRFCRDVKGIAPERRASNRSTFLGGSVPGLLGKRKAVCAHYTKPSPCRPARILPIRSVGGARPHASVPKNPRHSPAPTRPCYGWVLSKEDLAEILAQRNLRNRGAEETLFC